MLWIVFSTKVESEAAKLTKLVSAYDIWDAPALADRSNRLCLRNSPPTDEVNARYVKIDLPDGDCLQLGEVEVYGYLATEAFPVESMDVLTVGTDAARCWSTVGNRIMLTSDTHEWDDSHVVKVASTSLQDGKVYVMPLAKKKTAVDETFGYPDFAVEVALLDRPLVIEGEKDDGEFSTLGGHIIVLHTPHVHQHIEGVHLTNMGQAGRLGRYVTR